MKDAERQEDFEDDDLDEELGDDSAKELDEERNIYRGATKGLRRSVTLSWRDIERDLKKEKRSGQKHLLALEILRNEEARPKLRSQCQSGERPCPWISCRHHLLLDVDKRGSLKINFPDVFLKEEGLALMPETCSLDVADEHDEGLTLEEVGELLNLTRERIRQVETEIHDGLRKMGGRLDAGLQTGSELFENLVHQLPNIPGNGNGNGGPRRKKPAAKIEDEEDGLDFSLGGEFEE